MRVNKIARVIIVEDDAVTLQSLVARVDECPNLEVINSYEDVSSAQKGLEMVTPEVLLVDLGLPDGSGIDIISKQIRNHPDLAIMVISVFGDEHHVIKAIQAGARGYLLKDSDSEEIGDSIEQLLAGGAPISPAIARHLIKRFQPSIKAANKDDKSLSERESEVLFLASKGFSYAETAKMLDVSVNTVASYTKRVYAKLAVNSRSEAVFEATRMGLMESNQHFRRQDDLGSEDQ